jgi:hypothetical protein
VYGYNCIGRRRRYRIVRYFFRADRPVSKDTGCYYSGMFFVLAYIVFKGDGSMNKNPRLVSEYACRCGWHGGDVLWAGITYSTMQQVPYGTGICPNCHRPFPTLAYNDTAVQQLLIAEIQEVLTGDCWDVRPWNTTTKHEIRIAYWDNVGTTAATIRHWWFLVDRTDWERLRPYILTAI